MMKYCLTQLCIISLVSSMVISCTPQNEPCDLVVDMDNRTIETLYLYEYVESIEYISLETKEECLVGSNPSIYLLGKKIVVVDSNNCLVFDRGTGKWLRKIGNNGRGPNAYLSIPKGLIVNSTNETIYLSKEGALVEYSLNDTAARPRSFEFPPLYADRLVYLGDDVWAVGMLNISGNNSNQIVFYNRDGAIDSMPNHNKFELRSNAVNVNTREVLFYRYDDNVYYKHLFNDTIFRITEREQQPVHIIKMGNSPNALSELRGSTALYERIGSYYMINSILETENYLFCDAKYEDEIHSILHNKEQQLSIEPAEGGLANDLDGGLPFWPKYYNHTENELIQVLEAYEMKELLTEEYFAAHPAKDLEAHERLRELLKNLKEDDNPVIVIAKLK